MDDLLAVMLDARRLIARPENDFSWSSFIDQEAALAEIDGAIAGLRGRRVAGAALTVLFLPTGPLQEVALSSGWGDEFIALADRFDRAAAAAGEAAPAGPLGAGEAAPAGPLDAGHAAPAGPLGAGHAAPAGPLGAGHAAPAGPLGAGDATHLCALCGNVAATLTCAGGELRRETFTGVLTQAETPAARAALGDARALHELDFELAPFFCPRCDRSYCGDHWITIDVFEDGFHEGIRGTCPEGHERLLED